MFVLIEGVDRTGKSTLAAELQRLTDADVHHFSAPVPGNNALQEYVEPFLDYRPGTDRHVVLDRGHIGELVWPRYFGRSSLIDPPTKAAIDGFLFQRGALLVSTWRDKDEIREAVNADGANQLLTGDEVAEAQNVFARVILATDIATIRYEHGVTEPEMVVLCAKAVESWAEGFTRRIPLDVETRAARAAERLRHPA